MESGKRWKLEVGGRGRSQSSQSHDDSGEARQIPGPKTNTGHRYGLTFTLLYILVASN